MTENKDRRALERFEIPGTNVVCKKQEGFKLFNRYSKMSTMQNLSKSGICLQLQNGINIGDKLRLELLIPGETRIEIKGHVRWKSQKVNDLSNIGIQFEPFGRGKKFNSLSSLDKLREIQKEYN